MNYTENFEGIKLDVQAVDISISDDLQEAVRDSISKLKKHIRDINWVDVYFKVESKQTTEHRSVSMRLGIPGADVFASDTGEEWFTLLKSVEAKLKRQLEKKYTS